MTQIVTQSIAAPSGNISIVTPRPRINLRAVKYDSAQTNNINQRHWQQANDNLSPDASNSPEVRRILRNRSRYEVANNSYARGIVNTLAQDTIGTGPRIQLATLNSEINSIIEEEFMAWADEIRLAEKLRTMRKAKSVDGEAFAVMSTNRKLESPVKMDIRPMETDRVTSPIGVKLPSNIIDGIVLDDWGNSVAYYFTQSHPGDTFTFSTDRAYNRIPAEDVIHWMTADRPEQHRAIPELTPALPLFSHLRRYTLATILAAETAADFAAVLYTDMNASDEAADVDPMDTVELERNMATTLPSGWKLGQLEAEQPVTTYAEFKREVLNEIARCLGVPYNKAAANSSGYNYSSGRLDFQTYYKMLRVERQHAESVVLNKIFRAWLDRAILVSDYLPIKVRTLHRIPRVWFWDGDEHVDPQKEATAQQTRLVSHTTTLATEYAKQGKDWERELEQIGRERAKMKELGLVMEDVAPQNADSEGASNAK